MLRLRAISRFLMILLCLVPFTSAQQAGAALAPCVPVAPLEQAPAPAPAPASEEEDDERETDAREHATAPARYRPLAGEYATRLLPFDRSARPFSASPNTTPPVAADPFRNGLGSPYRC